MQADVVCMSVCVFLQELNELVQTIINTRETIKSTKSEDDLFTEANELPKDLLRSFQFTLQVILSSCILNFWFIGKMLGYYCDSNNAIFNCCC